MATTLRSFGTASMPERIDVTQDLERRFKEQEAAKQAAKSNAQTSLKTNQNTRDRS
jgi:hypothetical protein